MLSKVEYITVIEEIDLIGTLGEVPVERVVYFEVDPATGEETVVGGTGLDLVVERVIDQVEYDSLRAAQAAPFALAEAAQDEADAAAVAAKVAEGSTLAALARLEWSAELADAFITYFGLTEK